MSTFFSRGMARATAMTRAGNLGGATALIRSLLRKPAPDTPDGDVIEGSWTETSPTPQARTKTRRPLAETLKVIAAGGMPPRVVQPGSVPVAPPGASYVMQGHSGEYGRRDYRLYIPASGVGSAMPLVVMLHGCTQTPDDFALGTDMNAVAEEVGCMVAYPGQPMGANVQKCWNWYRPEDQARGRGEPALITALAREVQRIHGADPKRTFVAGLSAGGAAAVLVAAAYPDVFAAVGVHSGLPAQGAHDIPSAFAAMRGGAVGAAHATAVPTIVFHGTLDRTVHPDNGRAVLAQAVGAMPALTAAMQEGISTGGRQFRATIHSNAEGQSWAEHWEIEGAGHAWSGGNPAGSFADAAGPDASRQMMRFFLQHQKV